jgi:carbonic anhydrase
MKRMTIFATVILALCAALVLAAAPAALLNPDQALERLKSGNARFVQAKLTHPNQDAFRRLSTGQEGQKPFATILGCSDSRVPPELVFDTGLGDLFVVRVAGNSTYFDQAGTIEYGAEHLGSQLVVVLGHTKCGAVQAVVDGAQEGGNIAGLVANIVPAVQKARLENPGLSGDELVTKAVEANAWQSVEDLFRQSPLIRHMVQEGKVKVVAAVYDIETGQVKWLGQHPRQAELLALDTGPK